MLNRIILTLMLFSFFCGALLADTILDEKEIIQIAINYLEKIQDDVKNGTIYYDEGNERFKEEFQGDGGAYPQWLSQKINEKSFQAIHFDDQNKPGVVGHGDSWVLIDKNTGEIIICISSA
jgi:hypothetical protein